MPHLLRTHGFSQIWTKNGYISQGGVLPNIYSLLTPANTFNSAEFNT